jgi:formylglycine-generating enzyme required for sulfatase activity
MNGPTNPYIAGNPITGPEMFFGRQDVFRFVQETLVGRYQDNAIVLYGGRRTGKTSVLYQMDRYLDPKYVPVFVDLQAVSLGGLGEMLWGIARQAVRVLRREKGIKLDIPSREEFAQDPEGCFYERFLDPALQALGDGHLLLMLDEAARLYEQVQAGRLEPRAFDFLRSLIQYHPHLNFIFSIGSGLEEMRQEYALLFNLCQYRRISFLDQDAAVALITKPVKEHYRCPPETVERILEVTYGQPYYTQLVCNRLFARWARHDGGEVTPADVNAVLSEVVEQGMASLQYTWEEASDVAKVVLAALTELMQDDNHPVNFNELREALTAAEIALSRRAIGRALQELVVREVLCSTREDYTFTVDLMRLWVKQHQRLEWVKGQVALPAEVSTPAKRDWVRLILAGVSAGLLFLMIGLSFIVWRNLEQDKAERRAYATAMYGTIEALRTQIVQAPADSQVQRTLEADLAVKLTKVVEVATVLPIQELSISTPTIPPPTPTPTPPPLAPVLGDTWTRPVDEMVMVYVPAGEFEMGSDASEIDADDDEFPQHSVTLDGFWIDQAEVTNAQFAAFLNEQGNRIEGQVTWLDLEDEKCLIEQVGGEYRPRSGYADHPVVEVSWHGAMAYCEWVGGRLPTEAEWEYAARGLEGGRFPWGNSFDSKRLNYCDANCNFEWADETGNDGYVGTAPVGSFPEGASWCDALDMAGNVWEWVADWYGSYSSEQQVNPTGVSSGEDRGLRGGSWYSHQRFVRTVHRGNLPPDTRDDGLGFRCVTR